jgi:hypothetical protein
MFVDVPSVCWYVRWLKPVPRPDKTSLIYFLLVNMYFTFEDCASRILISIQYSIFVHLAFPWFADVCVVRLLAEGGRAT